MFKMCGKSETYWCDFEKKTRKKYCSVFRPKGKNGLNLFIDKKRNRNIAAVQSLVYMNIFIAKVSLLHSVPRINNNNDNHCNVFNASKIQSVVAIGFWANKNRKNQFRSLHTFVSVKRYENRTHTTSSPIGFSWFSTFQTKFYLCSLTLQFLLFIHTSQGYERERERV